MEQSHTATVIDSQSVKAPAAEKRGVRRGHEGRRPQAPHRRRHLATADMSDSASAQEIAAAICKRRPWLKHLFADGAYGRTRLMDAAACRDFVLEIVRRADAEPGFKVLPRRSGLSNVPSDGRRAGGASFATNEQRLDVSEAMIHLATSGPASLTRCPRAFSNGH